MKINRFKFRNLIIPILAIMACVPALTQANDNTLKVALVAEPRLLEPSIDTIKPSLVIGMTMLEPLTMNTAEGGYVPWLAESWTAIDQNR